MTAGFRKGKKGFSKALFLVVAFCSFAVLIKEPQTAIEHVREGLFVCAHTVIPSLFPFMVLSGLFVELGFADILSKILGRPMGALFGLRESSCSAPLMGALCGFPIGALTANGLYKKGEITKEELTRLLAISNIPSSAFLISSVGSALWSSEKFGAVLYVIQLLCVLITALFIRFFYPLKREKENVRLYVKREISVRTFPKVVSEAAGAMLNVCALILFFASVIGTFMSILSEMGMGRDFEALIYGFFEMSGAVSETARLLPSERGMIITALICGWSGLSVHFQVISVCYENSVSFVPYFLSKAVQGVLSGAMMYFYLEYIDPSLVDVCIPTFSSVPSGKTSTAFVILTNAVLVSGIIINILRRRARKRGARAVFQTI